jgi:hypothetical protein
MRFRTRLRHCIISRLSMALNKTPKHQYRQDGCKEPHIPLRLRFLGRKCCELDQQSQIPPKTVNVECSQKNHPASKGSGRCGGWLKMKSRIVQRQRNESRSTHGVTKGQRRTGRYLQQQRITYTFLSCVLALFSMVITCVRFSDPEELHARGCMREAACERLHARDCMRETACERLHVRSCMCILRYLSICNRTFFGRLM